MAKKPSLQSSRMNRNEADVYQTALLSRQALLQKLMGGKEKDINKECGYPSRISISNYKDLYDREGIAARVVDIYPTETWQEDPEVVESMKGKESKFEKAWEKLCEDLNLYHYLASVDELSGVGRFGILFLGINDGKPFSEPVNGINAKGERVGKTAYQLMYLRAMDESCVKIKAFEKDINNPRHGKPTVYTVTFRGEEGQADVVADVHWHRVIHVADNRGNSEVFGRPRMQNVYNRLYDLRKVLGGSGEMFWKGGFPGLSFEINPDMTDADFDEKSIGEQVRRYDWGLQRYLAIQGVTAKSLTVQVADPSKHVETALRAIAITIGCPFRIFLGSEQAQLASSQDVKSWNKRLRKRQLKYVTPFIVKPLVERLLAFGTLPEVGKEGYKVVWPDLNAPSDEDKAKVGKERTEALNLYVSSGLSTLIPPKEFFTLVMGYSDEVAEALVEASEDFAAFEPPGMAEAEDDEEVGAKGKAKPEKGSGKAESKGKPAKK